MADGLARPPTLQSVFRMWLSKVGRFRADGDGGSERGGGESAAVPAVEDAAAMGGEAHAESVRREAVKASVGGGE
jgi:hypothetical protein